MSSDILPVGALVFHRALGGWGTSVPQSTTPLGSDSISCKAVHLHIYVDKLVHENSARLVKAASYIKRKK